MCAISKKYGASTYYSKLMYIANTNFSKLLLPPFDSIFFIVASIFKIEL